MNLELTVSRYLMWVNLIEKKCDENKVCKHYFAYLYNANGDLFFKTTSFYFYTRVITTLTLIIFIPILKDN